MRNVTSALKQRRRNHPGDFPFFAVAALDTNYAAKSKLHDFIFFTACDEQGDEFAEKREVANDHQVAAGLFERFFRCGDLVLRAKAFALYETIARPDRPREQIPGLLCARFVTMPNGIDRKLQRTQKNLQRSALRRFLCLSISAADLLLRISILRAEPNRRA
jgi:hypothetical protein